MNSGDPLNLVEVQWMGGDDQKGYRLLDSGEFLKLEEVGPYKIVRPALSAPWPKSNPQIWNDIDATFLRKSDGSGDWKIKNKKLNDPVRIQIGSLAIDIKLTSFGHLGIFFEQWANWDRISKQVQFLKTKKPDGVSVLNLFGYTGFSSLVAAQSGAEVTHVDASKGTVKWAQANAATNPELADKKLRWIIEDVTTFVAREVRRGVKYQGIILDPPTYGRGDKKQVWKIEESLVPLLTNLNKILDKMPGAFVSLSGHSEGFGPMTLANLLTTTLDKKLSVSFEEMSIPSRHGCTMPTGYTAFGCFN